MIWYSLDRMLRVDFYEQYNNLFPNLSLKQWLFVKFTLTLALPLTVLLSWPRDDWGRVRNLPTNEDLVHWIAQSPVAIGLVTVETDSFRKNVCFSLYFYKTLSVTFFLRASLISLFFPLGANTKFNFLVVWWFLWCYPLAKAASI